MSDTTTTFTKLLRILPESETHWRSLQARAYRLRGIAGDDSWAGMNEFEVQEIREAKVPGSSREMRFCPRCLDRGSRYALLYVAGMDRCGVCQWPEAPYYRNLD